MRASSSAKGPSPVWRPWECVVLAIDTARVSGWCVTTVGKYVQSGEVDTTDELSVRRVVIAALLIAEVAGLPCVLVLEKPYGGNVNVVAALGAVRERWMHQWRDLAVGNLGKVVLVSPVTWRARVLPRGSTLLDRDAVRLVEQTVARRLAARHNIGEDEAPAICIGQWASHAGELAKLLGKRVVRKQMEK
jgi:hypothetical protein